MERPEFVKEEYLEFLDIVRESGVTNMYGARPYLMNNYPSLTKDQASKTLVYWMETFSIRHPRP